MDGKQEYVVVRNTQLVPTNFSDHQGVVRKLSPLSQGGDTVKILIEEQDVAAIHKYNTLKKTQGFLVQYSPGLESIADAMKPTQRLFIETNSGSPRDVQNRIEALREDSAMTAQQTRLTEVRLRRVRAMATIKNKQGEDTAVLAEDTTPAESAPDVIATPEALQDNALEGEAPMEVQAAIKSLGEEQPMTAENLNTMAKVDLVELAASMGITVRPGISKNGLVQQIINTKAK